jgi:hypothetical protein
MEMPKDGASSGISMTRGWTPRSGHPVQSILTRFSRKVGAWGGGRLGRFGPHVSSLKLLHGFRLNLILQVYTKRHTANLIQFISIQYNSYSIRNQTELYEFSYKGTILKPWTSHKINYWHIIHNDLQMLLQIFVSWVIISQTAGCVRNLHQQFYLQ